MERNITAEIVSILAKAGEPSRKDKIEAIVIIVETLGLSDALKLHLKSLGDDGTMSLVSDEQLHQVFNISRTWAALANNRHEAGYDENDVVVEFKIPNDR